LPSVGGRPGQHARRRKHPLGGLRRPPLPQARPTFAVFGTASAGARLALRGVNEQSPCGSGRDVPAPHPSAGPHGGRGLGTGAKNSVGALRAVERCCGARKTGGRCVSPGTGGNRHGPRAMSEDHGPSSFAVDDAKGSYVRRGNGWAHWAGLQVTFARKCGRVSDQVAWLRQDWTALAPDPWLDLGDPQRVVGTYDGRANSTSRGRRRPPGGHRRPLLAAPVGPRHAAARTAAAPASDSRVCTARKSCPDPPR